MPETVLTEAEAAAQQALQQELANMTGVQRAAVLMLLLGEQQAAELIKYMDPKEVQA
ncbi:MAG: flagellar motor switch protein FliG, partial [Limnohabitans sp.]